MITPDDGIVYESARKIWNGDIDKYPSAIIKVSNVSDVINVVNFAKQSKQNALLFSKIFSNFKLKIKFNSEFVVEVILFLDFLLLIMA